MQKEIVENLLQTDERCRSSDLFLIFKVCNELGLKLSLDWDKFQEYPSFEGITRMRRKFQEQGFYLPNQQLIEARKEKSFEYSQMAIKDKPINLIE